jgi:hypothetical protein
VSTSGADQPSPTGWYEIRLQGHLDTRWSAWLDGLEITPTSDGTTVIHGPVADQAALHGLLARVRDIGLPLISITQAEPSPPGRPPPSAPTRPPETDMTTTAAATTSTRTPQDRTRGFARASGLFYLLTFAASIPAWLLLDPILRDPGYILGAGHDTQVISACLLDFVNALAGIGSAVAVYPVAKRVSQSLSLGFVLTRMVEAAIIMIGVVALLAVVTMRQDHSGAAADASALTVTGQSLVQARNWTFLFGPGFMAVFNALMFATLLYRSRLVPRVIPRIGLVGAPLLLTADVLNAFGYGTQGAGWSMLGTLPIAVWELSVGFYMTFKGFRREAVAALAG